MLKQKKSSLKDKILELVDDFTIYSFYIPDLVIGQAMKSPLREERRPSFVVRYGSHENLYHKDYGDDRYYGNCFSFVMQKYNISFPEALRKIDQDLGLGIEVGEPVKVVRLAPPKKKESPPTIINVEIKDFTHRELEYWKEFGLGVDDLKRGDVFSVDKFFMSNKRGGLSQMYIAPDELCFAYKFEMGWKVVFPERKDYKWFSSVPNTVMEGFDNIKHLRWLIITKSRKDRLVLSKFIDNVVNTQNESVSFLTEENLRMIGYFKNVYLWFDNDAPGRKAAKRIAQDWKRLSTPSEEYKDPAEWVKQKGVSPLKQYIKSLGCYHIT